MVVSEYLARGRALVMDGKRSPVQCARSFDLEPGLRCLVYKAVPVLGSLTATIVLPLWPSG